MAYKINWKSDKHTIEEVIESLSRDAADYTNNRYTVKKNMDDGGSLVAVYAERDEEGNSPYHKQVLNNYMGWRCVWYKVPLGYVKDMLEPDE
jgi:hypothetical protein|tara:strand:+ start:160 stop:435 length:276 start_codon:yes stop_codon:yes gene_type:complete